jgi:hypothetical protein
MPGKAICSGFRREIRIGARSAPAKKAHYTRIATVTVRVGATKVEVKDLQMADSAPGPAVRRGPHSVTVCCVTFSEKSKFTHAAIGQLQTVATFS